MSKKPPEPVSALNTFSKEQFQQRNHLLGKQGITLTALTPAGRIRVEETLYDVVSTGDFIEQGQKVSIINIDSNRLMVEQVEDLLEEN